jgi:hypothetical protein
MTPEEQVHDAFRTLRIDFELVRWEAISYLASLPTADRPGGYALWNWLERRFLERIEERARKYVESRLE